MKNAAAKSLSELLSEFKNQKKHKKPILEAQIVILWSDIVGEVINRYTQKIYFKNKTLFVKVSSSALKNELLYLQKDIIDKYNSRLGEELVSKIVLL